jgi:antirestriction protein ArdC
MRTAKPYTPPVAPAWTELLRQAVEKPGLLLAAYSAFHNYSVGNQVLAIVQCAGRDLTPGPIATFPGWKEKGRNVKRGESALMLCMPVTFKDKADPDARRTGFIYKRRWFVLAQTEGEEVAAQEPPEWSLARALAALDITETTFELTDGNTQGYARKREIAVSPLAALPHKTRFHELAHVTLGHTAEGDFDDTERTPRSLREVEAEAVALILCETLGMPGADYCRGYIQNWLGSREVIPEASAQKIFRAADLILKAGQPPKEKEEEAEN